MDTDHESKGDSGALHGTRIAALTVDEAAAVTVAIAGTYGCLTHRKRQASLRAELAYRNQVIDLVALADRTLADVRAYETESRLRLLASRERGLFQAERAAATRAWATQQAELAKRFTQQRHPQPQTQTQTQTQQQQQLRAHSTASGAAGAVSAPKSADRPPAAGGAPPGAGALGIWPDGGGPPRKAAGGTAGKQGFPRGRPAPYAGRHKPRQARPSCQALRVTRLVPGGFAPGGEAAADGLEPGCLAGSSGTCQPGSLSKFSPEAAEDTLAPGDERITVGQAAAGTKPGAATLRIRRGRAGSAGCLTDPGSASDGAGGCLVASGDERVAEGAAALSVAVGAAARAKPAPLRLRRSSAGGLAGPGAAADGVGGRAAEQALAVAGGAAGRARPAAAAAAAPLKLRGRAGSAGCLTDPGSAADGVPEGEHTAEQALAAAAGDAAARTKPAATALRGSGGSAGCVTDTGSAADGVDGPRPLVSVDEIATEQEGDTPSRPKPAAATLRLGSAGCPADPGSAADGADGRPLVPMGERATEQAPATADAAAARPNPAGSAGCLTDPGSAADGVDGPHPLVPVAEHTTEHALAAVAGDAAAARTKPVVATLRGSAGSAGCLTDPGSAGGSRRGAAPPAFRSPVLGSAVEPSRARGSRGQSALGAKAGRQRPASAAAAALRDPLRGCSSFLKGVGGKKLSRNPASLFAPGDDDGASQASARDRPDTVTSALDARGEDAGADGSAPRGYQHRRSLPATRPSSATHPRRPEQDRLPSSSAGPGGSRAPAAHRPPGHPLPDPDSHCPDPTRNALLAAPRPSSAGLVSSHTATHTHALAGLKPAFSQATGPGCARLKRVKPQQANRCPELDEGFQVFGSKCSVRKASGDFGPVRPAEPGASAAVSVKAPGAPRAASVLYGKLAGAPCADGLLRQPAGQGARFNSPSARPFSGGFSRRLSTLDAAPPPAAALWNADLAACTTLISYVLKK
ncbi:hypothetical protein DIPPA_11398 [Diplonema papillatum]|nr:hypothetical protein DIPPA_11398 [Diplonema papillatum]